MRIKPTAEPADGNPAGPGTRRSRSSDHARKRIENRHTDDPEWKLQYQLLPDEVRKLEVEAASSDQPAAPKPPRLDAWLVEHGYAPSREKAKALVATGAVRINGKPAKKGATPVESTDVVEVAPL